MEVTGLGVVVTGAAGGIGRAIAKMLVGRGARVVINDLDEQATHRTAEQIGAVPVAGDAASQAGVAALVAAATDRLGRIDVYFANAGVDAGGGLDTSEQQWSAALEVNVLAHVRAAELLVPQWLASGGGRLVVTASAAGLLSMIGNAPYSVSKHAAVAFAEWLSVTYGGRGVVVQAICPQGVRTRMLDAAGPLADVLGRDGALEPQDVAAAVWQGLQDDRFLILPHPEVADYYRSRAGDPDRWLAAMRRIQRRVDEATADRGT